MMGSKNTKRDYVSYRKPTWAPPATWFGPVWSVLYVVIAVSFGFVVLKYTQGLIPWLIILPFMLNLFFNLSFTPLQFGFRRPWLATVDIVLVWVTLVLALLAIYPLYPWVAFVNIPYLLWVSFATVLQFTITYMNRSIV